MSLTIFTEQQIHLEGFYEPTVYAAEGFDAMADAERLQKAMKGWGTNEKELIAVLGNRVSFQRQEIADIYYKKYGKSLKAELKSETSGDFQELLMLLSEPLDYVDAFGCYKAVDALSTKKREINEIVLGKTNAEIKRLEEEYRQVLADEGKPSTRSLASDIIDNTSKDHENSLVQILGKRRDDLTDEQWKCAMQGQAREIIEWDRVKREAQRLNAATVGQEGADAQVIMDILFNNNKFNLQAISWVFKEECGVELYDVIRDELGGDFRNICLDAIEKATEQDKFYARLLRCTMSGLGTKDRQLQRLIVSRSEIDLGTIKNFYRQEYGVELRDDIVGDTSGDYKKLLLALIGESK